MYEKYFGKAVKQTCDIGRFVSKHFLYCVDFSDSKNKNWQV